MKLETSASRRDPRRHRLEVVERKGIGHPDTLSDHLAEALSRTYSHYTMDRFGSVLRHQFDKVTLMCGRARVEFGGGELLEPIRVLVNGRACARLGSEEIPVREMLESAVKRFFSERLPAIDAERDLRILYEVRHGPHTTTGGIFGDGAANDAAIHFRFHPRSLSDLPETTMPLANDTSLGCSFGPYTPTEALVLELEDGLLRHASLSGTAWLGSDIKTMAVRNGLQLSIVVAAPVLAAAAATPADYFGYREDIESFVRSLVEERMPDHRLARLVINSGDDLEGRKLYMNLTGSSIESGDEGQVGRGNRMGGVIAPLRPYTMEGICGKNPRYHVGKVYSIAAFEIASRLAADGIGSNVFLVNRMGEPLERPWEAHVEVDPETDPRDLRIASVAGDVLNNLAGVTEGILAGRFRLA